jgi:hypothetical protein
VTAQIEADAIPEIPEPGPDNGTPFMTQACTTCQGECCYYGGTHAFLSPVVIHRWIKQNPGASTEDCLQTYINLVPETTMDNSCVYHTDRGCALPRDQRSSVCNTWLCDELTAICRTHEKSVPAHTVFASGMYGSKVKIRLIENSNWECLDRATEPADAFTDRGDTSGK